MPERVVNMARLTDDFLRRINADPLGWPPRERFVEFFRDKQNRRGSIEHLWPQLKQGKSVPREVIVGLVEYLRERRGWQDITAEAVCVVIPLESDDVRFDFRTLVGGLTEQFVADDAMDLHHPVRDPEFAATTIMRGVGRRAWGSCSTTPLAWRGVPGSWASPPAITPTG